MEVTIFDPVWSVRPHAKPGLIEFLHVLKGRLRLIMAGQKLSAGPGDTLLVPAGVIHRDEFDLRNELRVFLIHFRWPAEREFFSRVSGRDLLAIPSGLKAEIGMLVDRMRADVARGTEWDRGLSNVRLLTVLALLLRQTELRRAGKKGRGRRDDLKTRRRQLMTGARRYLEEHFAEPLTLERIAQAMGVSAYYLSHVFSEESDFSLFAYLTALRMEKAQSLLTERRFSVKQVAQAVGYDDGSYFSRVFCRHFGCAPHATGKPAVARPRR